MFMILVYGIISITFHFPTSGKVHEVPEQELVYVNYEFNAPGLHTLPGIQNELIQFFSVNAAKIQTIDFLSPSLSHLEQLNTAFFVRYCTLFNCFPLLRINTERLFPFHFFL